MSEELRQGVHGQLPEPLSLGDQPVLEQRAAEGQALEEITAIELDRFGQGFRIVRRGQSRKSHGININGGAVEGDGLAVQGQAGGIGKSQSSAQYKQRSS